MTSPVVLVVSEHVGMGVRVRAVCSTPAKASETVRALRDLYALRQAAKGEAMPADYLSRFIVTTWLVDVADMVEKVEVPT